MSVPIQAAKKQLRSLIKQKLAAIPPEAVLSQSRRIFETLQNFGPYREAGRISIYLSMPAAEVQTDEIVRHALTEGKQVFVPYLHKSHLEIPDTPARVMDMVLLKSVQDYEGLQRDGWGIPSIDPSSVHERQRILGGSDAHRSDQPALDLMLLPGVAFELDSAHGIRRLGHGKGFYDFFLNRYFEKISRQGSPALQLYGLALSEQFLPSPEDQIPLGPYDRTLDGLILGSGDVKAAE